MQLLWFLLLIGVLIAVHELGHFVVARLCGVQVLRLGFGFGPTLIAIRRGETEYAISLIPLGGYVRLLGENGGEEVSRRNRGKSFSHKPLWQRFAIVLAGPAANLLFPAVIYFHFYAAEITALSSTIGTVFEGQPADGVLRPGDRIIAIDGDAVRYWEDVNRVVTAAPGRDLRVTFVRAGEDHPITKVVTPRAHVRRDLLGTLDVVGQLGVTPRAPLAQIGVIDVEAPSNVAPGVALLPVGPVAVVEPPPIFDAPREAPANDPTSGPTSAPGPTSGPASRAAPRPAPRTGALTRATVKSPATRAGLRTFDVITSIQGRPVETWSDLQSALSASRGEAFLVTYLRPTERTLGFLPLERLEPGTAQVFPMRIGSSGQVGGRYETGIRSGELFVHDVAPGSPAARAGIHPGDELTTIDGLALRHWDLLVQRFEERPDRAFTIGWRTPVGEERTAAIVLRASPLADEASLDRIDQPASLSLSIFGAEPARAERYVREIPVESRIGRAFQMAASTTVSATLTMVHILSQLLTLRLPSTSIGGPIMIYHLTGVAAARGMDQFLAMLALLSANLGLLNLLPVPVLDGGQLVFVALEALRRRPLSPPVRERAVWVGLVLLAALTLLAARNDVVRYWMAGG